MEHVLFPLEIAASVAALCGLHALKGRIGLAPLYVVMGLVEGFLFFAGQSTPAISAYLFADVCNVSSVLFLPLLLVAGVLIYTLEGTAAARWYVASIVLVYILHGVIDGALAYHAAHPPEGIGSAAASDIVQTSLRVRVSSLCAALADFFVILVAYQFLHNKMRALPLGVPLYVALVLAMAVDAVVFAVVNGSWDSMRDGLRLLPKLEAGFFAGLPLAAYLSVQLRKHKDELTRGVLDRGALEIVDLRRQLKEAKAQYLYIKDTFSRYVSPAVVDAIAEDPTRVRLGGEVRDVTVLFADIRGYSTLSEKLSPTEIITLLNRYFECVSGEILSREGMINEFEGDGILAVFGAPLALADHADRAVDAAVAMLAAVERLNAEWEADGTAQKWHDAGLDRMRIRIGIHSGPVVAGNVGSRARIKYAVIGDTVNTAARVEALNKELSTSLLCTDETARRLTRGRDRMGRDLGAHAVKGKAERVHVWGAAG